MEMPKFTKRDFLAIAALIIFIIIMAIPLYTPKGDCEVARPAYKCASAKDVITENCNLWSKYNCDSTKDASLPQIEWYISNLCQIHNSYHSDKFDCSNLKQVCNSVLEKNVC